MSTTTTPTTKIICKNDTDKSTIEKHIKDIQTNFKNETDKEPLNSLNNLLISSQLINLIESLNINGIDYPTDNLSTDFFKTLKSSILEKRNEEYLKNLKLIRDDVILFGIHFDNKAVDSITKINKTNVDYYLQKENCLIIYNENFNEYVGKQCGTGSGNGKLRNYRSDTTDSCSQTNRTKDDVKAYIYGIPTGIFSTDENTNIKHKDSMNDSISQIIKCVNDKQIKYVIWCVQKINDTDYPKYNMKKPDKSDLSEDLDTKIITLGLGTFSQYPKSVEAVKYISDILFKIFKKRNYYFSNRDDINTNGSPNKEHKYFNDYFETKYSTDVTPDIIIGSTVP